MALLVIILAGTVAIIYYTTYHEINSENRVMLEIYAEQYLQYGVPESDSDPGDETPDDLPEGEDEEAGLNDNSGSSSADGPEGEDESRFDDTGSAEGETLEEAADRKKYMVSTFYSVSFSADGSVLEINNEEESGLSDVALTYLANDILAEDKEFGTEGDVVYLVSEADDFILVTMMDNTVLGETISSLIRYTIIFGAVAIVVLFFISLLISKWIIQPLEISYKKQRQFISDAGHELKTPVSTIETNSEILSREIGENRWLSNIQYENGRMGALVKELLDLARLESVKADQAPVNLSQIALAGILPFEGTAFEQGLKLEYDIAPDIIINGCAAQLEELVSVLVDNAVDHTKKGGRIYISLSQSHSSAVFTVKNEGKEIPKEEQELIFDRFYRSDKSRTEGDSHYGLGLSIAKAVVTAHNGKININCSGGFTEFKVTLPIK